MKNVFTRLLGGFFIVVLFFSTTLTSFASIDYNNQNMRENTFLLLKKIQKSTLERNNIVLFNNYTYNIINKTNDSELLNLDQFQSQEIKEEIISLTDAELMYIANNIVDTLEMIHNDNITFYSSTKDTDYGIAKVFRNNRKHCDKILRTKQLIEVGLRNFSLHGSYLKGKIGGMLYLGITFYNLVKTGGDWDLKQNYDKYSTYLFRNSYRSPEYIGNYHYGYQGYYLGFPKKVLLQAAGLNQYFGDSSNEDWTWDESYFDDPRDQEMIKDGISEWDYNF